MSRCEAFAAQKCNLSTVYINSALCATIFRTIVRLNIDYCSRSHLWNECLDGYPSVKSQVRSASSLVLFLFEKLEHEKQKGNGSDGGQRRDCYFYRKYTREWNLREEGLNSHTQLLPQPVWPHQTGLEVGWNSSRWSAQCTC